MSKIISLHIVSLNNQSIGNIWGLNSDKIFDEIKYLGENKTYIRYQIDLTKNRKDDMIIEGRPEDIYRQIETVTNPASVTIQLVNKSNVSVSIEDVIYCYPDIKNFNHSYLYTFVGGTKQLYNINLSFLRLIEALNIPITLTRYTDAEAQAACNLDGTLYWSCAGCNFDSQFSDVDDVSKSTDGYGDPNANGISFTCQVNLPHGVTVVSAKVFGSAAGETWYLRKMVLSTLAKTNMASAGFGTEDTSIVSPVIDNNDNAYYFSTTSLDSGDRINGARIGYTL